MLKLGLDDLFAPEHIKAFRERWATDPDIAEKEAKDVVRVLTDPKGREAEIAKLVVFLVGKEPDFVAWMEALAVGSWELRPNVKYAYHAKRGKQPAAFYKEQQNLIDRVADKNLSPEEADEWRHAYTDALRLIIASQLLKEMRAGVAAKAALWISWPLVVAVSDKDFGVRQRKLLALFSREPEFLSFLRQRVGEILEEWIDEEYEGQEPSTRELHEAGLFQEPSEAEARAILQPVQAYRDKLFKCMGLGAIATQHFQHRDVSALAQAGEDAELISILLEADGRSVPSDFTSFRNAPDPRDYSSECIEELRAILPTLANETSDSPHFHAAVKRGRERRKLLDRVEDLKEATLVGHVFRWVESSRTPPLDLGILHASVFEDVMCAYLSDTTCRFDPAWLDFDFPEVTKRVSFEDGFLEYATSAEERNGHNIDDIPPHGADYPR